MQKLQSFVEAGNTTLTITGAAGTIAHKVQGSFPTATVTVYLAGTVTLATIYSDNSEMAKANPFTAAVDGRWFFYAANGRYDVKFSGGTIGSPFTLGDFLFFDESTLWANVMDGQYGADPTGAADSSPAFTAALADADIVMVPSGNYRWNSTVALSTGNCLCAIGTSNRWRGDAPVLVDYRGTGSALALTTTSGTGIDTVYVHGITFDGSNASGAVDGLLLRANSGGVDYIEGVVFEHCTFQNFPRYQVRSLRTVFDITFRRCSFMNPARAAEDLISCEWDGVAGAPSQWTFDDCWFAQYTEAKWCFNAGRATVGALNAIADLRFTNGTVTTAGGGGGANGVWVYGGITVMGTHFEGANPANPANVGIRYTGSNGAFLCPSNMGTFGRGIEIGNPNLKTTEALGALIVGQAGFANYVAGGYDCVIVDGGSRLGTGIVVMGFFTTTPFLVLNQRETIDGNTSDLRFMFTNDTSKLGGDILLNGRLGINMAAELILTVLAPANNGIRLRNSDNSDSIGVQLLNDSADNGFIGVSDSFSQERVRLLGEGLASIQDNGAAAEIASAILTLTSSTRGFLPPRLSTAQRDAIPTPEEGLMIYNTNLQVWQGYNGAWITIGP